MLGQWAYSRIGDIHCRVFTPHPAAGFCVGGSLGTPRDMHGRWPRADWGMINSYGSVTITALGVHVVDPLPTSIEERLKFDEAVGYWASLVSDWSAVMLEGPTAYLMSGNKAIWSPEEDGRLAGYRYRNSEVHEPYEASCWQWEHAYEHATAGESPQLSRKLLTFAMRAPFMDDGRSAVVHAATAAECALMIRLTEYFKLHHPPSLVTFLMNNTQMLGRRLDLAKQIGMALPADARQDLLEPRNAVMHQGVDITRITASKAVRIAAAIVNACDPIPHHCQEP